MPDERGDKTSQWARVAARLREEITAGAWQPGEPIPGELALAERYGVARGTVQKALALLRAEGVIYTLHGQGSYIALVPVVRVVELGPADRLTARMPEDAERQALGMAPGVPLIVIARPGAAPELHDGAVTMVTGQPAAPQSPP
jgi:DNA-binding FadR family transcriptional regulator